MWHISAALISKRSNVSKPKLEVWCSDDRALFSPKLVQFGPCPSEEESLKVCALEKIAKSSITHPRIVQFRSNLVHRLIAWHSIYCKSWSQSLRKRSRREITYQHKVYTSRTVRLSEFKLCENYPTAKHVQGHKVKYWNRYNSAVDCSIVLRFGTEFDHVMAHTLQMFTVKAQRLRLQSNITYQQ